MTVSFDQIPSTLRVPLFYAEVDPSKAASGGADLKRSLVIAQIISTGTGTPNVPVKVSSEGQAAVLGEFGSHFHRACKRYLDADPFGDLWAVPLSDNGVAFATNTVTIGGAATAAGTLFLYVGGQLVNRDSATRGIPVASGDTPTIIGLAIQTALGLNAAAAAALSSPYPVIASNAVGTVTITARNAGTLGNQIDIRANYYGAAGGEELPAGVTCTVATPKCTGGAVDPVLTTAIANMGDTEYDAIVHGYSDTTTLNALRMELAGRWGPLRQVYGHSFSWLDAAYAGFAAIGTARNNQYETLMGIELCPMPPWEAAAAMAGAALQSLRIDPARPLQSLEIPGILPPVEADRWTITERNTLLYDGIAQAYTSGGVLRIERAITTWQEDDYGSPSDAMLDIQTMYTLQYILRDTKAIITSKYGRHKLADDGTRYGPGQAIVTPSVLKGELISAYMRYEEMGLVENADIFAKLIIVERSLTDPNRVDVVYPPDLINQFRILALLAQFRLQYSAAEKAGS